MVSVTISHVIGTIALMVIFFAVAMFYSISYFSLQTEVLAAQLQEAADYVSANLMDLGSLCLISPTDQFVIKSLEMPSDIGTDLYSVTIVEYVNPITKEKILVVRASFDSRPSVYRQSLLPWTTVRIWNGTEIGSSERLSPRYSISSGLSNIVVWAWKKDEEITLGLGVMETG